MRSLFDLDRQNIKIESKLVVALERISEAFRVLLWNESRENSLSPLQIQMLIFLLFHSRNQCRVGYLAQEFNMTKATVSDSLKLLLKKGLIQKAHDPTDTRSYTIGLTAKGKRAARRSANFALAIEKPLRLLPDEQKEMMISGLLKLIYELNQAGIITVQRMCFTCAHYRQSNGGHYCELLQSALATTDLRVDCPEHRLINQAYDNPDSEH